MADLNGLPGYQFPESGASDFNAQTFLIQSILSRVNTTTLVKVVGVTNAGNVSPVGFVNIQPLVNQLDAVGSVVPHAVIYNCCYFRVQGGANAIIIDPQVGDIGIACFADRDISSVQINKKQSNPGSQRRFDMSDGIYLGGVLNGTPTQYVQFNTSGITITSPTMVTINGPLTVNGNVATTGTFTNNGKNISSTHTHSGVTPGTGNTGAPN